MNSEYILFVTIAVYLLANKLFKHYNLLVFKLALSAFATGVFLTKFQYTDKRNSLLLLVACFGYFFIYNYIKLHKQFSKVE
jgi:hypothetical protein